MKDLIQLQQAQHGSVSDTQPPEPGPGQCQGSPQADGPKTGPKQPLQAAAVKHRRQQQQQMEQKHKSARLYQQLMLQQLHLATSRLACLTA